MTNKDTLTHFWEILTDEEKDVILNAVNNHTTHKIHMGLLPFINRNEAISAIEDELSSNYDVQAQAERTYTDDTTLNQILRKLDVDDQWVDITCISDTCRKELNAVTGVIRENPLDVIDRPLSFRE